MALVIDLGKELVFEIGSMVVIQIDLWFYSLLLFQLGMFAVIAFLDASLMLVSFVKNKINGGAKNGD